MMIPAVLSLVEGVRPSIRLGEPSTFTRCLPARPAPLAALVREATVLVSQRVSPIAQPGVCLAQDVPAGSGMAVPGTVYFAAADSATFAAAIRNWPADRAVVVLHEVLHQVGMANDLAGGDEMVTEEGAVEAVTHDLRPALLRRVIGRDVSVPVAYRSWVSSVRRASAKATGTRRTSIAARSWRAQLVATPPTARTPA